MKKYYMLILVFLCSAAAVRAQVDDVLIFNGTNGANPSGSLLLIGKRLYGTTTHGGNNYGTVFAVDTDQTNYKELVDFNSNDSAEGSYPYGDVILSGNKLYGMTQLGGAHYEGCIFSVDTGGGNYKDLFDFSDTSGEEPQGTLVLTGNKLYGITPLEGTGNAGTIFRIDTSGNNFRVLFNFDVAEGYDTYGSIILVGNKFYGMEQFYGSYQDGTVFSIDTSGAPASFKDLIYFNGASSPQGAVPLGDVTYLNGKLYGMTAEGGAHNVGVIFSVDTSGNNYKDMRDFDDTDGNSGAGALLVVDSLLYGMTQVGGTGAGNIFSIDTSGKVFTNIIDFNGTNANFPSGSLILSNGIFYGTTYQGGGLDKGVVFSTNTCKLAVSIDSENVACYGGSTGSAIAILAGGTSPYTYQWTDGAGTDDTASALTSGTYSVTVTDTRGCLATAYTSITQPATALTATHDSVDDNGTCNGVAAVTVSGGIKPYTYLWKTGGQVADTIKNQCAGTYSVTVTDTNDCTLTTSVIINSSSGVNIISSNSSNINIYPEPTNGYFIIEGITQGQVIELYDYTGQKLSSVIVADNATMHFNISDKASGIYFIKIKNIDGSVVTQEKIVKIQ
jgi:uncharacterized repeat protein (TIGR03803 family)